MWNGLLDLIYPPCCMLCPTPGGRFCARCESALFHDKHSACPRCADTLGPYSSCANCAGKKFHFDGVFRLGVYDGLLREVVLRLKFADGETLGRLVGQTWAAQCRPQFVALNLTCAMPVPLHWRRRLSRGYNQAEAVGRGIAAELGIPMQSFRLWRVRATADQKALRRSERLANPRGAFAATTNPALVGKRVLLVDDVMTTGSTCNESALALKKAGAAAVFVAVLARATDGVNGG